MVVFAGQAESFTQTQPCTPATTIAPTPSTVSVPVSPAPDTGCEMVLPLPEKSYVLSDGFYLRNIGLEGAFPPHRGYDLAAPCGTPMFAVMTGTTVKSDSLNLFILSPPVGVVGYLHTPMSSRLVRVGDKVFTGQRIASVGNVPPSTGCHLHFQINRAAATDPRVKTLPQHPSLLSGTFVDPSIITQLFGLTLCPPWCQR